MKKIFLPESAIPRTLNRKQLADKLPNLSMGQLNYHRHRHPSDWVRDELNKEHARRTAPVGKKRVPLAADTRIQKERIRIEPETRVQGEPVKEKKPPKAKATKSKPVNVEYPENFPEHLKGTSPEHLHYILKTHEDNKELGLLPPEGADAIRKHLTSNPPKKTVKQEWEERRQKRIGELTHPDHNVRTKAISSIASTRGELNNALNDPHEGVRVAAASHVNATHHHLNAALGDESPAVRMAAIKNINVTRRHLTHATNDSDADVSREAKKRLGKGEIEAEPVKEPKKHTYNTAQGTSSSAAAHNAGLFFGRLVKGLAGLGKGIHGTMKKVPQEKERKD